MMLMKTRSDGVYGRHTRKVRAKLDRYARVLFEKHLDIDVSVYVTYL